MGKQSKLEGISDFLEFAGGIAVLSVVGVIFAVDEGITKVQKLYYEKRGIPYQEISQGLYHTLNKL